MNDITDDDGNLVCLKIQRAAQPVANNAADNQSDTGAAPDISNSLGATIEYQLAEEAEQNLRRATAGRPSDAQQRDPEDQGRGSHVAQALHVFVPRPRHVAFR